MNPLTHWLRSSLLLASALASTLALADSSAHANEPPEVRAAQAAQAFSGELRRTLMAAMTNGGPMAGVRVCHEEAPQIAQRVAKDHGVTLGRVGVRSRQPANRLEGWQKTLLDTWQTAAPSGSPAQWAPVVRRDPASGATRWGKAIETEGTCLACHGTAIDPKLSEVIAALYPDDPATGFELSSLRGLLWVEVAAPVDAPAPDPRQAIRLNPAQAAALRRQMRSHLEQLEGAMAALAQNDTAGAALLLEQRNGGRGHAGPDDFRPALPEGWRRFAAPMHAALREAAARSTEGDVPASLGQVSAAMSQCNACHATYRVEATGR